MEINYVYRCVNHDYQHLRLQLFLRNLWGIIQMQQVYLHHGGSGTPHQKNIYMRNIKRVLGMANRRALVFKDS